MKLVGTCWHDITIRTATEELGWPRRFTRARCTVDLTRVARVILAATAISLLVAALSGSLIGLAFGTFAGLVALAGITHSRHRCLTTVTRLVSGAAINVGIGSRATEVATEPPAGSRGPVDAEAEYAVANQSGFGK